jgi:hypothetical protein
MVEYDCMALIKALSSADPSRACWLWVITEIKELRRLLPECSFIHVRREAN